ncbi:MAG: phage head morphogenesis protein [Chloroflexi bacterium]|nr:phage head morphogenesis protein [Chloroflexota bacterium]
MAGEKPPISWLYEFERLQILQAQTEAEIEKFAQYANDAVLLEQREAVTAAQRNAERLMRASFPQGVKVSFNRLPASAFENLVGFLQDGSPLSSLLNELPGEAGKLVADGLQNGLLLGWNPKRTADSIREALGGNLARALRIARTETLRSYREATRQTYQANSDMVKGWRWSSARNERTCAACWVLDGSIHSLDEQMEEHICGRCAMVPITRSWKELGFDMDEIESGQPGTGIEAFEKLPHTEQIKILGPAKFAAWKDEKFALSDLVGRKTDPDWGATLYEKSLKELIGEEQAKGYTRLALMGVAQNTGNYSADDLIRVAGLGLRGLSPSELNKVVRHVAEAGFEPGGQQKISTMLAGQIWEGKVLQKGEFIKPDVAHYLKHVTVSKEWPEGTNLEEYLQSLKNIVEDPNSDIFISKYNDAWQVGFVGKSGKWQGAKGNSFIFVEYKVKYGYWVTGFQPKDIETQVLNYKEREILKWIRKQNLK